jgi:hypothetical protein
MITTHLAERGDGVVGDVLVVLVAAVGLLDDTREHLHDGGHRLLHCRRPKLRAHPQTVHRRLQGGGAKGVLSGDSRH